MNQGQQSPGIDKLKPMLLQQQQVLISRLIATTDQWSDDCILEERQEKQISTSSAKWVQDRVDKGHENTPECLFLLFKPVLQALCNLLTIVSFFKII